MINAQKLLGGMLKYGLKSGRSSGRGSMLSSLLKGGGAATIGLGAVGVAIAAFEHFSGKDTPAGGQPMATSVPPVPPPGGGRAAVPPPPPPAPRAGATEGRSLEQQGDAILLIQAMIAAANADGSIDASEKEAILKQLKLSETSPEERNFLQAQFNSPPSVDTLLPGVSSPELACQVYAVSLLAIDVDTKAERDYLTYLRMRLDLSDEQVRTIHEQLGLPLPA